MMESIIQSFMASKNADWIAWIGIPLFVLLACCYVGIKRFPRYFTNNHGIVIAVFVFAIIEFYHLTGFEHFAEVETWQAIIDNILSGALFSIMLLVLWKAEKKLKNKFEDKTKLTTDYEKLAERYKKDNLVKVRNNDGSIVTYPIINLGEGDVSLSNAEYNDRIVISDNKDSFYRLPYMIETNFNTLFAAHDTSEIFNNVNIRATDMCFNSQGIFCFSTERTTYYYSLVTNRAADYEIIDGLSVRQLYEYGPKMTELTKSMLSNHIGFKGFIESSDGFIVFVRRTNTVSIEKETYGTSIGASLKTKYALDENGKLTYPGFREAIINEIRDELKIDQKDLELNTLSIFAIYRDCVECGKPQFLMYAKSKKTAYEITKDFKIKRKEELAKKSADKSKATHKKRKESRMNVDGTEFIWIPKEQLKSVVYHYNDITVKKAFVRFGAFNDKPKSVFSSKFAMVPSASASVYLFCKYLFKPENTSPQ